MGNILASAARGHKRRRPSSHDRPAPAMGEAIPAAPSATPCTPSLTTFLHHDTGGQEGPRLLLPFLTTNDRLQLSACCHGLLPYRYNLTKVEVIRHPSSRHPTMRAALDSLLMGQDPRGGGLEYLRVGHRSLMGVLDLAPRGCFRRLKTLDVSGLRLQDESMGYVERALLGAGLESLEELDLSENGPMGGQGLRRGIGALSQGACPRLRRLNLGDNLGLALGEAVAGALESGHLNHLQDLRLSDSDLGPGGMAAIAKVLQRGACPQLARLDMPACGLGAADGQALAMAMRAGGCAKLEDLSLGGGEDMGDQGYMAILESLGVGSCPNLMRLNLGSSSMGLPAATALGHALLFSGSCPHLKALKLESAFSEPACLHALQAIHQGGRGAMPNLLHLNLATNHMGAEHGQVLGEALGAGAFPKLEWLDVSLNELLGDDGVVAVMAGLERGGCPHLTELRVADVGMGPQGGQALGRTLASGSLSCLQTLGVGWNAGVDDEAMREVMVGLKGCHQLREMCVCSTGMGREAGGALVQALREGAWPHLRWMNVSDNRELFADEEVGRGLVEVVEGGKVRHLSNLQLNASGMSREVVARVLGAVEGGACPRLRSMRVDPLDAEEGWGSKLRGRVAVLLGLVSMLSLSIMEHPLEG